LLELPPVKYSEEATFYTHNDSVNPANIPPSILSALLKTLSLEYSNIQSTLLNIYPGEKDLANINLINFIASLDSPPSELLLTNKQLYSVTISEISINSHIHSSLNQSHCILSLGGSRGIGYNILLSLANQDTILILVGSKPLALPIWFRPTMDKPTLVNIVTSNLIREGLKPTPVLVSTLIENINSTVQVHNNIEQLQKQFLDVYYLESDLTEQSSSSNILTFLTSQQFYPDIILNIAGVIHDNLANNKKFKEFDQVVRIKLSTSWLISLLLDVYCPKCVINFSSVSCKFGNIGQVDYAMVNEYVNSFSHFLSRRYPQTSFHSINWGPWSSAGMATNDVLSILANRGILPIPLQTGSQYLLNYIQSPDAYQTEEIVGVYDKSLIPLPPSNLQSLSLFPYLSSHTYAITQLDNQVKSTTFCLLFNSDFPYLQGHIKFNYPVVPAASVAAIAMDAYNFTHNNHPDQRLYIIAEVLSGIKLTSNQQCLTLELQRSIQQDNHDQESSVINISSLLSSGQKKLHYRLYVQNLNNMEEEINDIQNMDISNQNEQYKIYDPSEQYGTSLFHTGIFKCIAEPILFDSIGLYLKSSIRSLSVTEQLSTSSNPLCTFDPVLLDGIFQLGLVGVFHHFNTSALPSNICFVHHCPSRPGELYQVIVHLYDFSQEASSLMITASVKDTSGNPIITLLPTHLTHSKGLLG